MTQTDTQERADLLETLDKHRFFLRHTLRELTDEQARQRSTASALTLGGLVRHVTATERMWANFISQGPSAIGNWQDTDVAAYANQFEMTEQETIQSLLVQYAEAATGTDELVRSLDNLDAGHPLPEAPWFAPGTTWSARRVLLHIIAETAQHAGHADIIRESLDGAKSMG
ncbi:MAG: DinB family protein [Jatrophihabitantaceae bacterium]